MFSAVMYTGLNVSIRLAAPHATVWHMVAARGLFVAAVMVFASRQMGISLWGRRPKLMMLVGAINAAGVTFLLLAIVMLPLFEALVLLYLFPSFAAILSPKLAGDRIGLSDWGLVGLALAGTVLILWPGDLALALGWGHVFGVLAGFSIGLTLTLLRGAGADNNSVTPLFFFGVMALVMAAGPLAVQEGAWRLPWIGWLGLLAVAACAAAAQLATCGALLHLPSHEVGVISILELALTGAAAWFWFGEPLTWMALFGAVMIVGSGLALNLKPRAGVPG